MTSYNMILVATCLIPARSSVDSDASLGEKSATRHKCGHERSRRLLGLACCVCLSSRCCCRLAFLPPSSSSVRVCFCRQFVLIKSFCFVCNSCCCCCCCCGETLTHSLSRLVSDTGATTRRVRGTAAVVGVSCYLESGSRKREKKQDHHRFFGDPAFYQVCFTLFSFSYHGCSFFFLPASWLSQMLILMCHRSVLLSRISSGSVSWMLSLCCRV